VFRVSATFQPSRRAPAISAIGSGVKGIVALLHLGAFQLAGPGLRQSILHMQGLADCDQQQQRTALPVPGPKGSGPC